MKSWPAPALPSIPGHGGDLHLHDTRSGTVEPVRPAHLATMYVCGITPYDATHLGHAATYVTFDVIARVLRDNGHEIRYAQNVTDVDEPLLERAARDGVDWQALAASEIGLFREDMTALGIIPPDVYVGVIESVDLIADAVKALLRNGRAYRLATEDGSGEDVYFDLATAPELGEVSGLDRATMLSLCGERGGDPERLGKRDPLDPLLWRAHRDGEPVWAQAELGPGRPGWHIECTAITVGHLGMPIDIKGGGSDLVFPHHEMSAVQAHGLTGEPLFARHYIHQAMVGYQGAKMSKSRGNLVLVSSLRHAGVDPMAIRLLLLAQSYRTDWEYREELLTTAVARLERWRAAFATTAGFPAAAVLAGVRERLADDLDTPGALEVVDRWVDGTLACGGVEPPAPGLVARSVDALLGVRL